MFGQWILDGAKDKLKSVLMIFQIKDAIRFMTNATHKFVINSKEKSLLKMLPSAKNKNDA